MVQNVTETSQAITKCHKTLQKSYRISQKCHRRQKNLSNKKRGKTCLFIQAYEDATERHDDGKMSQNITKRNKNNMKCHHISI